ncbi:DUF3560 domain-containing protein [Finegoldia sp. BIOML-A3]|uniref:DUF3560 domain-containing protein n=1 Tax=unclassified Finegoldia TaxID=2619637 RepID=UPI0012B0A6DB|nr:MULTISPECIES: DUF3560 domain-containing protein [unclassified Finegoldia]MSA99653.1 DUF3560 domain-containing protein [Finegoldia sp. BIOML-A3]MSB93639.1 DUF3560 domain-containing protein [Finegoldia sp. BIOML-A4]
MAVGRKDYFERKELRVERLREKADKMRSESVDAFRDARKIQDSIPMGQPILIGHYSEKRSRRDRDRIDANIKKSIEKQEQAEYYDEKLAAAENNKVISSDNPQAIELLEDKISKLKARQQRYKDMNKYYRKHKTMVGFEDLSDEKAAEINKRIDEDYSFNKKPAPSYILSNLNAMIKSTEKRLEQLKELDEMEYEEIEFDNCTVISNDKTNRVEMHFGYKPGEDVRSLLKRKGFKWSRNNECWQRMRNKNSLNTAISLAKEIDEM